MRTPAGTECAFFYGNYYRGKSHEECRLIGDQPQPDQWTPDLCKTCPVPMILRANACEHMTLKAFVHRSMFGFIRRVKVSAFCSKSQSIVTEPQIGCGQCHPLPPEFNLRKP
jgi:hypothetical protein